MAACELAEISRANYYKWKSKDPNFKRLMKRAMKQLEETLFEAACNHGFEGDATLLIFLPQGTQTALDSTIALSLRSTRWLRA